ncbi:anti-phage ZorAB system protein ZorA [Microbulbifer pacificus]|uniref:Anti-phage ZorAB system protein ZorA n=1 Tax=Microbulbifer pacificus TaxID=407164 RepID=A0AAU0N1P6_9GAMM|nr:anti-phage ZorAB system protein ZorA [Microbulbifer pacificus]WOX05954.1 anti-phage ZorAB system protein ZorA [Microbulbifer pacificus]
MEQSTYSLGNLWPQFGSIFDGRLSSPEGLSAVFVTFLILATVIFGGWALNRLQSARKALAFYESLVAGVKPESLLEQRRDLTNRAMQSARYGDLWREFDESLVPVPQKQRLCNTLDAAHFFNTHTLARSLTENRLLAAVPGFLTAIGVIGTFAGLTMGLGALNIDTSSTDVDKLRDGIFGMIGGAKIAFMTSVWGVFTSVVFNLYEKLLERNIRARISRFQARIDNLFPRITAEQSLSNIEDFSRQSMEKLAELDEKIGHKMQEAMQKASVVIRDGMEQSLNNILGPAIQQLVQNAHSGSEKALESLLERFLKGVGDAGKAQEQMLKGAATDMGQASEQMVSGLNEFTSQLKGEMGTFTERNATAIREIQEAMSAHLAKQHEREEQAQKAADAQFNRFISAQDGLTEGIQKTLDTQQAQHESISAELNDLVERFKSLAESHVAATQSMQQAASDMKGSSNQLGMLSTNLRQASDSLEEHLETSADQFERISSQNEAVLKAYEALSNKMEQVTVTMSGATDNLMSAAEMAESGLGKVQESFDTLGQSMKQHVSELQERMNRALKDYADAVQVQTSNRMSAWNEQTNNYISSMTNAVSTINELVDEIDGKLSVRGKVGHAIS